MSILDTPVTRRGVVAGFAAGAAAVLAGCSSSSDDKKKGGVTTVTVMYQANEFTPAHVAAFEAANPDIKISFIEYDDTRLNAMYSAGSPPDLVRSGPSANLFARKLPRPLDDYIAKSTVIKEADLVPANDVWRWDGKKRGAGTRYGILKDWSPDISFWQNTKLLQKAGVKPFSITEPTTWENVLEVAKKLKAAGVAKYALGMEWQWGLGGVVSAMIHQAGGEMYNEDFSVINVDTPQGHQALQWFADYASSGVGVTSDNPLADGWDLPSFQTGKMAMSLDGYWLGGSLAGKDAAAVTADVQLIPAPTWANGGTRTNPLTGGIGGYIPLKSKNPDEAWRVMEFFFGGPPAVERSKGGWGLPAFQSLWNNLPTALPFQRDAVKTVNGELKYVAPAEDSPYLVGSALTDAINKEVMALAKGKNSVEQAAKNINDQINPGLKETKDQLG